MKRKGANAVCRKGRVAEKIFDRLRNNTHALLQVLVALENLMSSLPKIHRSLSEPILNRTNLHTDDLFADSCSSPKTPVNAANLSSFTFVSNAI
jgi:B-Raf proto-oncogene serine/threonine-protein kinase